MNDLNKTTLFIICFLLFSSALFAQTTRWRLIWTKNDTSDHVNNYLIYKDTVSISDTYSGVPYNTVQHQDPQTEADTLMEFIDDVLQKGKLIYYRLKAENSYGISDFSKEVSASIPLINLSNWTIYKNQDPFTKNLDEYVTDIDNMNTEISWDAPSTTNLEISFQNRIVTISRIDTSWYGTEPIIFTATDPDGFFDVDTILFTVLNEVLTGPQITYILGQTIPEGSEFSSINLDDYVSDPDYANTEISWTVSVTTHITITINNRVATITVNDPEWNGSETVTFTAENPDGLTASYDVTFIVTPVNDPPVVTNIPNQTIEKDGSFSSIDLDEYVSDVDNTDEEISWTTSPSFDLTITITNRVATIIPNDPEWSGQDIITFRAEDPQGLEDSDFVVFSIVDDSSKNQFKITAFPIPFRPSQGAAKDITFINLPDGGKLIIYDLLGYLVFETDITSTEYAWKALNQHGKWVRSGVYLYVVKDAKGKKVKSDKVIIIR